MTKTMLIAASVSVALAGIPLHAQVTGTVDSHLAAAKAAAGTMHTALYDRICKEYEKPLTPPPPAGQGRGGGGGRQAGPPPASQWHAEPAKVFDNLYFVGMKDVSAWAVNTSEGIIVLDALYDYSVDDEIAEGLKKVGLDPAKIKYVIVSHGHGDHSAGAKYLQDRYNARVMLSANDWDLLDRGRGTTPRPRRDMVGTDGQKLTLGDTTITMYLTPGHTPGTLSYLIPVKDGGVPHLVAEWGGTAFNFPRTADNFRIYTASAERFGTIAASAGADALISNHSDYDGSKRKIPALKNRKRGDPHPYVVGNDSVKRYRKVAEECSKAWVGRAQTP